MKVMGDRNPRTLVIVLVGVVIVLALLVVYAFILKPSINGYVTKAQNEGVQYAIFSIMQQAAQCQQVPLKNPFGNETMNLVWTDCLQQPQ